MSNTETWHPIPGFPGYAVSNQGRVYSWKTGKYKSVYRDNGGHPTVALYKTPILREGRPRFREKRHPGYWTARRLARIMESVFGKSEGSQ